MIKNPALPYRDHIRAVVLLGLPLIGGHLAQFAIWTTDTVMLGRYGVEPLAASVLAGSLFMTLFIMGSGFAWAVLPMVAAAAAEGDEVSIRRITRMGLWLSLLFALPCMMVFYASAVVFGWMGQEAQLATEAQSYLQIAGWGIIPGLAVMVLKSYLAAQERTQVVLWITVVAAIANGVINYALIFGNWGAPELGLRGAAIGSVAVQLVSLIGCILYALTVLPQHHLFQRVWRPDWEFFLRVFKLGVPIGLTNLSEVGLFATSAILIGWLGAEPLAAHGIALQIATATFMVHMGLSNAATVRAGASYGRRDRANLKRGGITVIALSLGVVAVTLALMIAIPDTLVGLFLSDDEPARDEILSIGVSLLFMAALFQVVDAMQVQALGLLRGLQDSTVPMIMAAVSYWLIGLPSAYVFGFVLDWGAVGVWTGLVFGLASAAVLLMARFWLVTYPRMDGAPQSATDFASQNV